MVVLEVVPAVQVILRPCGEHEVRAAPGGGVGGRGDPLGGPAEVMDRLGRVAGVVLDRAACQARPGGSGDGLGHLLGLCPEAVLEVARHGDVDRLCDRLRVGERLLAGDGVVAAPEGRPESAARRGERREAERPEQQRRADVPGIADDQRPAGAFVKEAEAHRPVSCPCEAGELDDASLS
jgi:hypothetical protein